jgi:class 3 adenylate cyclase
MVAAKPTRGCLVPVPANAFWAVGPDNHRISSWTLHEESMTIGRSSECNVVVRDPSVSRRHAILTWSDGKLLLTHLSLTSPTLLNGVPVRKEDPVELASSDKLQIGGAHIEVLLWSADNDAETRPHAPPRALAVVLAADVVGYTAMCKRDETGTLERFHECLRIFRQEAQRHRGRVLDTGEKGDCVYSLYHSIVLALSAAVAIRKRIVALNEPFQPDRRINFRYGMHCGDVLVEGEGIRGDAINTAAHLQEEGEPNEIMVSARMQQEADAHREFTFEAVRRASAEHSDAVAYRLVCAK